LSTPAHILSICIASYGDDVSTLLNELEHCEKGNIPNKWSFEIIISDQHPEKHPMSSYWEEKINCRYIQRTTKGRSANRNGLSQLASGEFLLFLDADSLPSSTEFLTNYCNEAEHADVVIGGTAYLPGYKTKELRVRVGKQKEEIKATVRMQQPFASFSAFNFLIRKTLFDKIQFSEDIVQYGHEDTLFGLELKYRNAKITHINNPAFHMGIDTGADFMNKTTAAVDELAQLIAKGKIDEDVKLFKAYRLIQKSGFHWAFKATNWFWGKALKKGLADGFLPVMFFDVYKLLRLCSHSIKIGRRMP
tara:strand:- start:2762 stop:3676 length:915 start_codon:yes stop_codon:yes gene_type:complete